MLTKYTFAWFGMMVLAIINGSIRDFIYGPMISEQAAHQISTITLILLFAVWFRFLTLRWPIKSSKQAWKIGTIWLFLTLVFETSMGLFLTGQTLSDIIQQYNILTGNLWVLIPFWTFIGPRVFFSFQKK
ncbi:MAG: hypothetical protein JJU37_00570 [Balneolaceae bacterium]|nr:hypothetical protein [Balneolaceae bacterium]